MLPASASILSILQTAPDFKRLEQYLFNAIARQYREELTTMLAAIDGALMQQRPPGLRHRGFKTRVLETKVGPVTVRRRRYLQTLPTGERRWRYLLDEALGLPADVQASPGLRDRAVELAVQLPYRQVAAVMAAARPDGTGPSHGTVHRWVSRLGAHREAHERARVEALFEHGELPETAGAPTSVLFVEADELRVAVQGAKRRRRPGQALPKRPARRAELRIIVGHRGWQPRAPGSAEYRLVDKHVYAHVADAPTLWRGATLSLHGAFALEAVQCTVLNGDGAPWIRHGLDYLPHSEYQLDRWHLRQAIKAGLGWHARGRQRLWTLIDQGAAWDAIARLLQRVRRAAPDAATGDAVQDLRTYLWESRDGLAEYRQRALPVAIAPDWRGLGAAESNVDKPWANRLTKRGTSWSSGLVPMVRLMTLHVNGTLQTWLEHATNWTPSPPVLRTAARAVRRRRRDEGDGAWLQVHTPSFTQPRSQLTRALRQLGRPRLS